MAMPPINGRTEKEPSIPCTTRDNTNAKCKNDANDVIAHNQPHSAKSSFDSTQIDAHQLNEHFPAMHSPNTRELNEFILDDDFQFDEKPSATARTLDENYNIISDMFDDGSGHHASINRITSTSKPNNNFDDGKITVDDKIRIEGDDVILNDAPSIIFYDSPTVDAASRKDDDRQIDKFTDSSDDGMSDAVGAAVGTENQNENVVTYDNVRDKYKYSVVAVGDTPNENDANEIEHPNDDRLRHDDATNERAHDLFHVETAPPMQPPIFHMLDDTNRLANDSIEKQTQRILVNVSIATDSGVGTKNHGVYMLHVSVPVGPEFMSNIDLRNASYAHHPHTVNVTPSFHRNDESVAAAAPDSVSDPSSSPSCPCDCNAVAAAAAAATHNELNSIERDAMANESTRENDGPSTIATATSQPSPSPTEENRFCLNEQDIPPILILEGEPYR